MNAHWRKAFADLDQPLLPVPTATAAVRLPAVLASNAAASGRDPVLQAADLVPPAPPLDLPWSTTLCQAADLLQDAAPPLLQPEAREHQRYCYNPPDCRHRVFHRLDRERRAASTILEQMDRTVRPHAAVVAAGAQTSTRPSQRRTGRPLKRPSSACGYRKAGSCGNR